ncbi:Protein kinase domain, partial [Dillenia turbinata]
MKPKPKLIYISTLLILLCHHLSTSRAQPSTTGYTCTTSNTTTYPCQTYVFYRAQSPDFLDLASIGDLFSVSRLMISKPSNISSPDSPLIPDQNLFVPITCSCNPTNTTSISYASLNYTIKAGNTFYIVSTHHFENLTDFQSVEVVNPTLIPSDLPIGVNVIFPIFCMCPNTTLKINNKINYLVTYVIQPSDNLSSIASKFNVNTQQIVDFNGNKTQTFDTLFIPISQLPQLSQPNVVQSNGTHNKNQDGAVIGLSIGLGICGVALVLVFGLWGYREFVRKEVEGDFEGNKGAVLLQNKGEEMSLMADVSDCLDKYRVFGIEELREATDGFDSKCVIEGSVYKGCIGGEMFAIKKMKWNAYDELKILQKVNHGNLVKIEGFCIEPEEATCYLVYEYVENGSLHSWLHGDKPEKLDWKTRLRIAIDVANGLQYIHDHARPRVVHKDIKSSNILIDSNMRAKIANFGLAKSGCNAITMHIVGTQGYIAPEYLVDGVVSTKMDVFSFGVVLLELISGREAIDEGRVLWASANGVMEGSEEEKMRRLKGWMDEAVVSESSSSMQSVMTVMAVAVACIQKDPSRRPSMVDIVYALCKSDDIFFDISDGSSAPQ